MGRWLRKLAGPLVKSAARVALSKALDEAEEKALGEASNLGPKTVDLFFDGLQRKISSLLLQTWIAGLLPGDLEERLAKQVQEVGDSIQEDAKKKLSESSPLALENLRILVEAELLKRIDSLLS